MLTLDESTLLDSDSAFGLGTGRTVDIKRSTFGVLSSGTDDHQSDDHVCERTAKQMQHQMQSMRMKMRKMVEKNKGHQMARRLEAIEVGDRQVASQIQMILSQQNKLIHNYYEMESKFRDMAQENKFLKNEFADLKKHFNMVHGGGESGLNAAHLISSKN